VTDIVSLGAERGTYHLNAAKHNVVLADKTYHGEIKVAITFTSTQTQVRTYGICFEASWSWPWMPACLEAWSQSNATSRR
jgi:hypothetical protein